MKASGLQALNRYMARVTEAANGRLAARVRRTVGAELLALAQEVWRTRTSPYGKPWTSSLERTGETRRSLRLIETEQGMALLIDGRHLRRSHGHDVSMAVVHNWGGTIRSRFKGSRSRGFRKRLAFLEQEGRGADSVAAAKRRGARPMRFKVNGRWVSVYSFTLSRNEILPSGKRIPEAWLSAVKAAAARALGETEAGGKL
jgi:hypothetical protein